jgi:hypothetical protein
MRLSTQHRSRAVTVVCRAVLAALVLVPLLVSSTAQAVKVEVDKDTFLDLHLLLQPWVQLRHNDPADAASIAANPNDFQAKLQRTFGDFYVRRTRFVIGGQVTKWVSFFAETDMPNWGKGGNWNPTDRHTHDVTIAGTPTTTSAFGGSGPMYIQDAYLQFNIHEAFNIVGGMILTPFIHNGAQGATSLHTLDYHADLMKYPNNTNKVWRDNGVMFRGFLFKKHLDYRISITNGVNDGTTMVAATATAPAVVARTGECPRFSGRLQYNFFDAEEGFFLAGTYLGKKKILSLGFAYDAQPKVYGWDKGTYWALGGDVFVDLPMGKNRLSGQLNFVGYGGDNNPTRGKGMLFDLGYAIGKWEPIVALDWYRPEVKKFTASSSYMNINSGLDSDLFGAHLGLNWWFLGHTANVKLDVGFIKNYGVEVKNSATVVTLQTQLYL